MSFMPGWFPSVQQNPARARFVNSYAINFGGTTFATATIPAVDLTFPASPTKQILVTVPTEAPFISGITIDGVNAPDFCVSDSNLSYASAYYAGSGPFNVVITLTATSSEVGRILVWEVDDASPLHQNSRNIFAQPASGTLLTLPLRIPGLAMAIGSSMSETDTQTSTWSGGLTEVYDQDAGDYALSGAIAAAPTAPMQGFSMNSLLDTISGAGVQAGLALAVGPMGRRVEGGIRRSTAITSGFSDSSVTTSSRYFNFTGLGDFKLILTFVYQGDPTVTSVTHNGVAMNVIGHVVNAAASPDLHVYAYQLDITQAAPSGSLVINFSGALPATTSIGYNIYCMYNVGSISAAVGGTSAVAIGAALALDVSQGGSFIADHVHDTAGDSVTWTGADINVDISSSQVRRSTAYKCHNNAELARPIQATASGAAQNATMAFALNP